FQIIPPWQEMNALTDLVQRVGRLLAFQTYDPNHVVNPVAHQWVVDNATYIPTDPAANLALEAGGKPIERISRSGAVTLAALKDQLRNFCQSLLDPTAAPPADDVIDF